MNLSNVPDALHSKLRLSIILATLSGPKDFTTLLQFTEATPGNLGRQLENLEVVGYLTSVKVKSGRRTKTIYTLTDTGRDNLIAYYKLLQEIIGDIQ